ncbi:MAG: DUF262 domain-containing protein [Arcobacteraceae bacterium]
MDVQPDKQNIDKVFSNTTYYIDFYQREYKWTKEPVEILMDDIFYRFNSEYEKYKTNEIELEELIEKYNWYYLNTYVTNKTDGRLFIVDGQQRLTTLTLILIKLYNLSKIFESELNEWISTKIVGLSGYKKQFWMYHVDHIKTMEQLFNNETLSKVDVSSGITAKNMLENYKVIDKWIDKRINDKHKLESFIFYFLKRLVLINLDVSQTDVPMVFEVINDRGVKLKPYEILKGKLLGQIKKDELESLKFNDLWDDSINSINNYSEDEVDEFFMYFLRSKYSETKGEAVKYDSKNYHRTIFSIQDINLEHNDVNIKKFLKNEFKYYTKLYAKILKYFDKYHEEYKFVFFNSLTDMDTQFLLIMSSCNVDDEEENEKIKTISKEVDKFYVLTQLQRSWDSNKFSEYIYQISNDIREKNCNQIEAIFSKHLKRFITEKRVIETNDEFSYTLFKDTGISLNPRFKRYFFARIEEFIALNTNMNMKHNFSDLVTKTGSVNGFHIEHILSFNDENLNFFNNDEEIFENERNRLGGLLLLKGKDNISSSNELYEDKLKTYANTLYWNETLREDTYKSKLDFTNLTSKYSLNFESYYEFGKNELEKRHKLLFDISSLIWSKCTQNEKVHN